MKKKMMIAVLVLVLVISGISVIPKDADKTYAAETNTYYKVGSTDKITDYWMSDRKIAPDITDIIEDSTLHDEDWAFAGWYKDETCKNVWTGKTSKTDVAYAKFVPSDIFAVACQVQSGTVEGQTGTSQLRLVSTVDSLNYNQVGFKVSLGDKQLESYWTDSVAKTIEVTDSSKSKVAFTVNPTAFNANSKYFTTVTVVDITADSFTEAFYVIPCWETLDGTQVEGFSRYARVEDSYKNIVNVPVRLCTDEEVGVGQLTVTIPTGFTYSGYDVGSIFEDMKVYPNETAGTLSCMGVVDNVSKNKTADGMYINLRFSVDDLGTANDTAFAVDSEQFCDVVENLVTIDVSDAEFKNYNQ